MHKVLVDDVLRAHGICMVSACSLCLVFSIAESIDHLLVTCSFKNHVWCWLEDHFCVKIPSVSFTSNLWGWIIKQCFSPQLYDLWIAIYCFIFYSIWHVRNRLFFNNELPSLCNLHSDILTHIRYLARFCPDYVTFGSDKDILCEQGISWHLSKAPKALILSWRAPPEGWIKVNTDGLAKGNLGQRLVVGFFGVVNAIF